MHAACTQPSQSHYVLPYSNVYFLKCIVFDAILNIIEQDINKIIVTDVMECEEIADKWIDQLGGLLHAVS